MRAAIVSAEIQLEGMRAENAQRAFSGFAPAYVEEHFQKIILEHGIGYNDVIRAFQEAQ